MRTSIILLILLVITTGCNKSEKPDPAQLKARQAVKDLGATIQGRHSVTVQFMKKDIQDSDLATLVELENVSYLDLNGTTIGDEAMSYLPKIKGLQVVILNGTQVTDAGMAHLEGVTELVQLTCNENIGDAGLASIAKSTKLNYLNLANSRVTDDGLVHIASMKSLNRLNLDGTEITDKGLQHLQQLTKLHTLQLSGTKISDDGLPLLQNLSNLSSLVISETGVTAVAVAKLQNALPDTGIDSGESMSTPMGPPGGGAGGGGGGGGGGRPGGGGGGGGRGGSFNPEALVNRIMESNDKDEDGILSAEEIEGIPEQFRDRLTAADADEDGTISKDELLKYYTERAAQRGSGGGGRPGGGEGGGRPSGGEGGRPGGDTTEDQ